METITIYGIETIRRTYSRYGDLMNLERGLTKSEIEELGRLENMMKDMEGVPIH